ncbi:tetratricopeptide repeat protein [Oligoflexus tunisiensis]|uniref:tetratricopeptide repeat protein n=1 Tax=Oligoflexus tunisiensis TaxID=708132 RepID=UPI00114D3509|nr:tetratricopeptide repeat protein [Oligoflexus tunisiensis]
MRRTLVQLLVWMSLVLTAGLGSALAQTVSAYEAALNDYRANRIRESVRALKAILLKDPRNKEAAMLLGTIYYQNHKLKKAYYLFEKGDPALLTPENAFAWGSTYLEFDEDKKAALGFRYILKNKAPFRPFATYYLGVIAYKAGQWQRARKYFQKVNPEDLTVALRVNRRRYLADIKKQQDKLLESIIGGTNRSGQDLAAPQLPVTTPMPPKDSGTDEELMAPLANALQVEQEDPKGWRHSVRPAVMLAQQNQLSDNHGLNNDNVNLFAHREGISGLVNYGDGRKSGGLLGGFAYLLGDIGYSAQLDQVQYFTLEQTSGLFTSQASSSQNESSGFLSLQPNLGVYLNPSLRLELAAGVRSYFPDYDAKQAWGQASEQVALRYESAATELGFELTALQPFDEQQKKEALDLAARADVEQQFGDLRVNLQGYGWQTDHARFLSANRFRLILADPELRYRVGFVSELGASAGLLLNIFSDTTLQLRLEALKREPLSGARLNRLRSTDTVESVAYGAGKSLASLNIPLGDSASITASAAYNLLTDYHYTEVNAEADVPFQEYVTDVEQFIYQAGAVISFAEWIRLSGSYTITTNNFTSSSSSDREFRRSNPNYTVDADFYLELAKTF